MADLNTAVTNLNLVLDIKEDLILKKPDMSLFDFGGTILLDDQEPDFVNGTAFADDF
jgi:hypothetical protein